MIIVPMVLIFPFAFIFMVIATIGLISEVSWWVTIIMVFFTLLLGFMSYWLISDLIIMIKRNYKHGISKGYTVEEMKKINPEYKVPVFSNSVQGFSNIGSNYKNMMPKISPARRIERFEFLTKCKEEGSMTPEEFEWYNNSDYEDMVKLHRIKE